MIQRKMQVMKITRWTKEGLASEAETVATVWVSKDSDMEKIAIEAGGHYLEPFPSRYLIDSLREIK